MPNRKDRRAQRAQERKARRSDTMGKGFTTGPLPPHVTNHPAFKAGEKAAAEGTGFPQGYYDEIEKAAKVIFEWVSSQTPKPDLRWIEQKEDGVFIAADLDLGAGYLADSPDAFRLLAWLDQKTDRKLSLNQATWALRRCRALPMPDGTYYGTEKRQESEAYRGLLQVLDKAKGEGLESDRIKGAPCPHCGKLLDAASSASGHRPNPGDVSMCIYCAGALQFDDELQTKGLSDEQIEAFDPASRDHLREMQALLRSAMARKQKGPVAEA